MVDIDIEALKVEQMSRDVLQNRDGAEAALASEMNALAKESPDIIRQINAQMARDAKTDSTLPSLTLTYNPEHIGPPQIQGDSNEYASSSVNLAGTSQDNKHFVSAHSEWTATETGPHRFEQHIPA